MGPGYVGTACCTVHNSSLNYFRLIYVFTILIIILKFSIIKQCIVSNDEPNLTDEFSLNLF